MFRIKNGISLDNFSEETKVYLLKAGFSKNDDLSNIFENIVKKKVSSSEFLSFEKVNLSRATQAFNKQADYELPSKLETKENV